MQKFLMILSCLWFFACGQEKKTEPYPAPQPQPTPQPTPQPNDPTAEFNATVKPILTKSCAGGACHTSGGARDAVIQTASNFINGASGQRIQAGNMPPAGTTQANNFTAAEKSTVLAFIAKYKK